VGGHGPNPGAYYYRRKKARQWADVVARKAVLDRLAWQVAELRASLDRTAAFHAVMAEVLGAPLPLVW
jgi:hypothetical protein